MSRVHIRPLSPVTLCLLGLATVAGTANASGFRIPEASIAGLGTANALVANSSELGALVYNPAGQSFHEGTQVVTGVIAINPSLTVTTASGYHESHVDDPFYAPSLYATSQLGNNLSLGLNISSPFGLETNWPAGTFPLGAAQPSRSKITMVNFNPNLAYKIGSNTSVAAGIDYYWVKDVRLDIASGSGKISGNGADYGMNIAMLHKAGDWSFGGSYRTAVSVDIKGTISNVAEASAILDLPWMLQIGARLQANDKLAVELDIERTGWNKFNQIRVLNAATGASITNTNAWKAANAYRLGMTYQLSAGTQLRIGYTYDETPQVDEYFSARIPDADRHLLGIGASQKVGDWTLEGGYMYVTFKDREYVGSRTWAGPPQDTNGTTRLNGSYSADVHLLGLGASTRF